MKNTKDIIVLDENVKHISLFRHVLPWIVSRLILFGLTVYGLFSIPFPEVLKAIDDVLSDPLHQVYLLVSIASTAVVLWMILKRMK